MPAVELNLQGKSVVITGGAAGIGRAIAMKFAREGARISVCGRTLSKLEAMKEDFLGEGYAVDIYQVDVTNKEALEHMAQCIARRHGIDIWVNNAGIAIHKPVMAFTGDDYKRVMDINLEAVFEGCRIAGGHMIRQGRGGVIINASSFASKIPHTEGAVYAAAKAGVSSLTKTFAASFAPYGIRVVGFVPGMIVTEMTQEAVQVNRAHYISDIALQRLGKPEDLAKPVVFLASDVCGYITGVELEISGGKYIVQNSDYSWKQAGIEL